MIEWGSFAAGFAACLALGIAGRWFREYRERSAFLQSLSQEDRNEFTGYSIGGADWRGYRDFHRFRERERARIAVAT